MKIDKHVFFIGRPEKDGPEIIGEWRNHNILEEPVIGESFIIDDGRGNQFQVSLNVGYAPGNPKRERLISLLEPRTLIPEKVWEHPDFTKHEQKTKDNYEEYPF